MDIVDLGSFVSDNYACSKFMRHSEHQLIGELAVSVCRALSGGSGLASVPVQVILLLVSRLSVVFSTCCFALADRGSLGHPAIVCLLSIAAHYNSLLYHKVRCAHMNSINHTASGLSLSPGQQQCCTLLLIVRAASCIEKNKDETKLSKLNSTMHKNYRDSAQRSVEDDRTLLWKHSKFWYPRNQYPFIDQNEKFTDLLTLVLSSDLPKMD